MMRVCEWEEASAALKPALGDHFGPAREEVKAGRETAFKMGNDSFALLRIEQHRSGDLELVAVGFAGDLKAGAKAIFEFGLQRGCRFIRCHTTRYAELRFLRMIGLPVFDGGLDDDGFFIIRADYGR